MPGPDRARRGRPSALSLFVNRVRRKIASVAALRWLRSNRYLLLHAIDAASVAPVAADELHCNCLEDLQYFEQTERWLPREVFIEEARRRIAEGMKLYTAVSGTKLVHYGWLVPRQEKAWFPYVGQEYRFPPGSAVLFNAYTHPAARGGGLHLRSMRRRIADAAAAPGTERIFTAIESHNRASRAVAAKAGFVCVEVLFETIRFGTARRGILSAETYFSTIERRS